MQQITEINTAADLEKQCSAASASLARLQEAATDAKAEAERWRVTFEREPTAQAHTEMVVAQQRALNAEAAAQTFEAGTLQPLATRLRHQKRDAVAADLAREHEAVTQAFSRAARMFVDAAGQLDAAMALLQPFQEKRAAARGEAVSLAPAGLEWFAEVMNQELSALSGPPSDQNNTFAAAGTGGGAFSISIRRPTAAVPGEFK